VVQNAALDAIMGRRSVRAFRPGQVGRDELDAILAAGQAAPYAWGDCRHFTVVQDRAVILRLNRAAIKAGSAFSPALRERFMAPGYDGTYGAPTVVIVSGNEETLQHEAVCAASVENMLVAAKSLGVGSCWAYFVIFAFNGEDGPALRAELGIREHYKPCASVLLGYEAEAARPQTPGGQGGAADERWKNGITFVPARPC
jgi:nitroreductase